MYIKKRGKAQQTHAPKGEAKSKPIMDVGDNFSKEVGPFHILEAIGRGGFGTVYRGINTETGVTVAIKRVTLQGIPPEELESIEMEIRLLQNLTHANIVKYIDAIRSDDFLNIVLEMVENGALSSLLTKFDKGGLPEKLTAVYTAQVLQGLHYLHTQGVIHRDIKGANILSTKSGRVKLADFGVATKLNESRKSDSVVGTPYWMAPEIIEMTGHQSSACDIWSVGCTVIELLTGKPPYFDLQQMPALFRIVQDPHPPLPDSISPALEDFLMQCFEKDPVRRIDAASLLKHPWLKGALLTLSQGDDALEEQKESLRKSRRSVSFHSAYDPDDEDGDEDDEKKQGGDDEEEDIDWGDDDDEPVVVVENVSEEDKTFFKAVSGKTLKPAMLKQAMALQMKEQAQAQTAKTKEHQQQRGKKKEKDSPLKKPPAKSALKSQGHKPSNKSVTLVLESPDKKKQGGQTESKGEDDDMGDLALKLKRVAVDDDDDPFGSDFDDDDTTFASPAPAAPARPATTAAPMMSGPVALDKFAENDDEDEDDDEFDFDESAITEKVLEEKKKVAWDKTEADDFDVLEGIVIDEGEKTVDATSQLSKQLVRVLENFSPKKNEQQVLEACNKLTSMDREYGDTFRNLMCTYGVIPIMEMLEVENPVILHAVLQLVNKMVGENQKFQQSMSIIGLIPAVIRFGSSGSGPSANSPSSATSSSSSTSSGTSATSSSAKYPPEIRAESANFVRQFCFTSDFSRKMFIACGGLSVIVSFLKEPYLTNKTLVWNAIDCIRMVFEITSNNKNDFLRLFCKFGLLSPLVSALHAINADKQSESAPGYAKKIGEILYLFSYQGDAVVKTHFAKPSVIEGMLRVLPELPQDVLLLVLKSIRYVCLDSNTCDLLEAAGAIPALMPLLDSAYVENQNFVLQIMYYLCQLKTSRQEQVALAGIIPHLQRVIVNQNPLKQFAYPIIFMLAKTSARTRMELKKYGGVQFYLDVLNLEEYWRAHALEALAVWLQEEPDRIGFILNTTDNLHKLFKVFATTENHVQIEAILPLLRRMLTTSVRVNISFGRSPVFMNELKRRLERHSDSNNIRINLLKILALIVRASNNLALFLEVHQIMPMLDKLCKDTAAVMVMSLAGKLVSNIKKELAAQGQAI